MKANDLPLGFVVELTSLSARIVGELAADYGIQHTPENASKVGMLLVNVGITMMTLQSEATNESIKKEISELIETLDVKKLQEMFNLLSKKEYPASPVDRVERIEDVLREMKATDKKNIN